MESLSVPITDADVKAIEAAIAVFEKVKIYHFSDADAAEASSLYKAFLPNLRFGLKLQGRDINAFVSIVQFARFVLEGTIRVPDKLRRQLLPHKAAFDRLFPVAFPFLYLSEEGRLPPDIPSE